MLRDNYMELHGSSDVVKQIGIGSRRNLPPMLRDTHVESQRSFDVVKQIGTGSLKDFPKEY